MKHNLLCDKLRKKTLGIALVQAVKIFFIASVITTGTLYLLVTAAYFLPKGLGFVFPGWFFWTLGIALPALLSLATALFKYLDVGRRAVDIERAYPELQDKLITAFEVSGKDLSPSNPLGRMFARSLEKEVMELMDRFGFGKALPFRRLVVPCGLFVFLVAAGVVHAKLKPEFFKVGYQRMTQPPLVTSDPFLKIFSQRPDQKGFKILVVPGDCKVPMASDLEILADIEGGEPGQVNLYTKKRGDTAWRVFPMACSVGEQRYRFLISPIMKETSYYVKADSQASDIFNIKIFQPLALTRAVWSLKFPVHTHLEQQSREGWHDKLTVPRGTVIALELKFSQDVERAQLIDQDNEVISLDKIDPRTFRYDFAADKDRVFRLEAHGKEGDALLGMPAIWVQAIPDLTPFVEVIEPQLHNYVFATQEIPFVVNVNDDYGVRSVTMVIRHRGKEEHLELLPPGEPAKENRSFKHTLYLERLGLGVGELVTVFLEARDNYPGPEDHLIRTEFFTFLIRDFSEQFKLNQKDPPEPSLRALFEDILLDEQNLMKRTWDHLTAHQGDGPAGWEDRPKEKSA
jgi:hypothetical protein